jgi:hypothetical protein
VIKPNEGARSVLRADGHLLVRLLLWRATLSFRLLGRSSWHLPGRRLTVTGCVLLRSLGLRTVGPAAMGLSFFLCFLQVRSGTHMHTRSRFADGARVASGCVGLGARPLLVCVRASPLLMVLLAGSQAVIHFKFGTQLEYDSIMSK